MNNIKMYRQYLLKNLLFLLLVSYCISAQRVLGERTLEESLKESEVIVYAKILSSEPYYTSGGDINTLTRFKTLENIKGSMESNDFSFEQPGGTIGGSSLTVTNQITFPSSGNVVIFFYRNINIKNQPLVPIEVCSIKEEKAWVYGWEVNAKRFVDVLKKAIIDASALPTFYDEIRKEEEVRNEAYKKGFGLENIEQIRKHDPILANKIEVLKLEPWILPSGLPRPPIERPATHYPPGSVKSGIGDGSTIPEESKRRTQRLIDSLKSTRATRYGRNEITTEPGVDRKRAQARNDSIARHTVQPPYSPPKAVVYGRGDGSTMPEEDRRRKQRMLDSLARLKADSLKPPSGGEGRINEISTMPEESKRRKRVLLDSLAKLKAINPNDSTTLYDLIRKKKTRP